MCEFEYLVEFVLPLVTGCRPCGHSRHRSLASPQRGLHIHHRPHCIAVWLGVQHFVTKDVHAEIINQL